MTVNSVSEIFEIPYFDVVEGYKEEVTRQTGRAKTFTAQQEEQEARLEAILRENPEDTTTIRAIIDTTLFASVDPLTAPGHQIGSTRTELDDILAVIPQLLAMQRV